MLDARLEQQLSGHVALRPARQGSRQVDHRVGVERLARVTHGKPDFPLHDQPPRRAADRRAEGTPVAARPEALWRASSERSRSRRWMRTAWPGPPSWTAGISPESILRRTVGAETPSFSATSAIDRYSLWCSAVVIA